MNTLHQPSPAQAAGCWLYLCKYMQITFPTLRWPSLSASCGSAGENIIHQSKLHQFGRYSTSILKMQNSDDCIKFQSSESGVLRQMSKHNSSDRNCTGPWLTYILIMGYVSYTYNTLQMMNDLFGDLKSLDGVIIGKCYVRIFRARPKCGVSVLV